MLNKKLFSLPILSLVECYHSEAESIFSCFQLGEIDISLDRLYPPTEAKYKKYSPFCIIRFTRGVGSFAE